MSFRLSQRAASDLEDILVEGIVLFGEQQALKYQLSFARVFELLAQMPRLGRRSVLDRDDERCFVHGSHVIFYRVEFEDVVIETIVYGPLITDLCDTE